MAMGMLSLVAGVIGVFVPVWPTTPFLLLSAACFLRSSERLYEWLVTHRHLGRYVRDLMSGRGIPLRAKVIALATMWLTTTASSVFMVFRFGRTPWTIGYAIGLAGVALWVHRYIGYTIPTRQPGQEAVGSEPR
jgi:hypothetical protein